MENRPSSEHTDTRNMSRNVEKLQLTEEEKKVLKDCRLNSMIRGVPVGLISALVTKFAISSGKFPHLARWSSFYYPAFFTGGLLFGVASYRTTCLAEIMKLENSVLADQVRQYFKKAGMEYTGSKIQKRDLTGFNDSPSDSYCHDLETASGLTKENITHSTRSINKENKWPNDWGSDKHEESKASTFEELRKQNRQLQDQYPVRNTKTITHHDSLRDNKTSNQHESDQHVPTSSNDKPAQGSTGIIRRNKYGDPIQ